jgi:hypothetical protein
LRASRISAQKEERLVQTDQLGGCAEFPPGDDGEQTIEPPGVKRAKAGFPLA